MNKPDFESWLNKFTLSDLPTEKKNIIIHLMEHSWNQAIGASAEEIKGPMFGTTASCWKEKVLKNKIQ